MSAEDWTAAATVVIAAFTVILAISGGVQAYLTRRAINLASAEFIATHRPKIRARQFTIGQLIPDQRAVIHFEVVNIGDTRATITEHNQSVGIVFGHDLPEGLLVLPSDTAKTVNQILVAGQHAEFFFEGAAFSEDDIGWFRAGRSGLYVHGEITYRDDNKITRKTGYLRVHDAESKRFRATGDTNYDYED